MSEKPSLWADLTATAWVVTVGVFFYGGYLWPDTIGMATSRGMLVYATMFLIGAVLLSVRYLSASRTAQEPAVSASKLDND